MRIGLYHGYELTGSGSNEYNRYLARFLSEAGNEVHIICREDKPETIDYVSQAYKWKADGSVETLFAYEEKKPACYLHQLPHGEVRPVYLTDKQRDGNVKSFVTLSNDELSAYHELNEMVVTKILSTHKLDVLHTNHLIYQPIAALEACRKTQTPMIIYPHGSAIEYTVKQDKRFKDLALKGILGSSGLIIGNREVRDRILDLYPEHRHSIREKSKIVGVGVDTSLFMPVSPSMRAQSIQQLIETKGDGGKNPDLKQELYDCLKKGDVQATQRYWDSYNHSLPDADLNDQLKQIPWDSNIVFFVGALTVGKGIQSVITALPGVLKQNPNTHFIIVGAGAYREVLEALVYAISVSNKKLIFDLCNQGFDLDRNELSGPWEDVQHYLSHEENLDLTMENGKGIHQHIHFLGRLDHSRLRFLFPCADVAIFPSVIPEAYPLVVMESLSNGVLPLVSYFSGFKDSVDDLASPLGESITNLMKIPMDREIRINTIISHLNMLLADKKMKKTQEKLRQIAVDNFDWRLRADQMVDAYKKTIHPFLWP